MTIQSKFFRRSKGDYSPGWLSEQGLVGAAFARLFAKEKCEPPANDNSPFDPEPAQGVLGLPANDNGLGSAVEGKTAAWAVILAAGSVLVAANLAYLPSSQKHEAAKPVCPPGAAVRVTPHTLIASLSDVQFTDMIRSMERQEGFGPRTLAFRAHNPGNVNIGNWARRHGAVGDIHGIAVFESDEDGRQAMKDLIKEIYGRRTILGMLAGDPAHGVKGYAPKVRDQFGKMGNPELYAEHVAMWMNEMAAKRASEPRASCSSGSTSSSPKIHAHKVLVFSKHALRASKFADPHAAAIFPHGR